MSIGIWQIAIVVNLSCPFIW